MDTGGVVVPATAASPPGYGGEYSRRYSGNWAAALAARRSRGDAGTLFIKPEQEHQEEEQQQQQQEDDDEQHEQRHAARAC